MKRAVITGASKGLGKALARELSETGYELLLIARSEELLKEISSELYNQNKTNVYYLPVDLALHDSVNIIQNWCLKNNFKPDVLINNAGFACWGYFDQMDLRRQQDLLQVNIFSLVNLTHMMIPFLKENQKSYILNVCSTSAYQAVPTMALYAASKSFVRIFSRALKHELKGTSVSVTCLSPGPMATNFINAANMDALKDTAQKFEMDASVVAKDGLKAMFKGKAEVVPGFTNALSVFLTKLVPDVILEKIAEGIYKSKLGK